MLLSSVLYFAESPSVPMRDVQELSPGPGSSDPGAAAAAGAASAGPVEGRAEGSGTACPEASVDTPLADTRLEDTPLAHNPLAGTPT